MENKKNYALWLYPETVRRMDSSLELANCQSRSEFVEKALHFYMGYLVSEDVTAYAAMHEKEKHIHVHMIIFSADAKEGFLTKEGIRQIKSSLVRQIYKDDLINIYQEQTNRRAYLQENASKLMRSLIHKMQDGELNSPQLEMLIAELADRLHSFSGKKVYGYLPPATKRIVDAIVDELAGDYRVAEAYSLWQDMRDAVFSFYSRTKPERVPLSQQKEFKVIRNMVIREVMNMVEEHHTEKTVNAHSPQTSSSENKRNNSSRRQYPVAECMIRMLHHMGNIFRDNVGAIEYRGLQLDKKRRKELQEWKIALGHREDDHEDPENYPKSAY